MDLNTGIVFGGIAGAVILVVAFCFVRGRSEPAKASPVVASAPPKAAQVVSTVPKKVKPDARSQPSVRV